MTSLVEMEEVGPAELTDAELDVVCGWFLSMDPEFFAAFSLTREIVGDLMRQALLDDGSEYGAARFVRRQGELAGAFSAYPASEILGRRSVLLRALIRAAGRAVDRAAIARHAADGDAVSRRGGTYLSKLFVADGHRRYGLGVQLLRHLLDRTDRSGLCLHVHKANMRALRFYEAFGFAGADDRHPDFLLMTAPPHAH